MDLNEEGNNTSHGIIIPIPDPSSKIINIYPSDADKHIAQIMANWIENPYIVESFGFEEENDENYDEDDVEGTDDEEDVDDEKDVEDEEDELDIDKEEASVHGVNSPPKLNKHIYFSYTSSSTTSIDDIVHCRSTPHKMETTHPLIQDVNPPSSASPNPQDATAPPTPTPHYTASIYQ